MPIENEDGSHIASDEGEISPVISRSTNFLREDAKSNVSVAVSNSGSFESLTDKSACEKSETEQSTDSPDSSSLSPVYRSTTEILDSFESKSNPVSSLCCCCCNKVSNCYTYVRESIKDFSQRQWRTLIVLMLGTLTSSLSVCLFPPFFPRLAEEKGEGATVYGIVIGTNCLTAFLVTPIIGKKLERIGVNFVFLAGLLVSGFCCCLSGFLEYFPGGWKFISVAICIRVVHATANAGVITASIAFMASEFPTSVAFLFSLTRSTMNFAQMFGPAAGGALHNVGGFKMPFFVLGALQVVVSMLCIHYLPAFRGKPESMKREEKPMYAVLRVPGIWVAFHTFVFSTMSNGFLSITLEPRVLRQFHISPFYVGVMFGLKDGANCIASPVWGWLCDRMSRVKLLIVAGSILAALSFVVLGPFPGLPIHHTLALAIIALILNGFGIGGQQVSGVITAMNDAVDYGFPDEAETHAFIAGLWSSLSGAGRFISRTGSGILVDHIGFKATAAIVTGLHITVIMSTTIFMVFCERPRDLRQRKFSVMVENSPSEPSALKTASISVPMMREDLEGSFMIGSGPSRASRKLRGSRFRRCSESIQEKV